MATNISNSTLPNIEVRGKRRRSDSAPASSDPYPRGRSVHATRAFQPGELVLELPDPAVVVPRGEWPCCGWCLSRGGGAKKLLDCSGCAGATVYCGRACQRSHWRRGAHKAECAVLRRIRDAKIDGRSATPRVPPVLTRALIQVLGDPRVREAVDDLEGNVEAVRERMVEWQALELQARAAVHYSGKGTVDEATVLACKVQCNAHSHLDDVLGSGIKHADVALLVDPTFAMINHACVPNAEWFTKGRTTYVIAAMPLAAGDEITIRYRDCSMPTQKRRAELAESYYFTCTCKLCMAGVDLHTALASGGIYPQSLLKLNKTFSIVRYLADERGRAGLLPYLGNEPITEAAWSKIYASLPTEPTGGDSFSHFRRCWPLCRELVSAGAWALSPLLRMITAASDHLLMQIRAAEARHKTPSGLYVASPEMIDRWTDVACLMAFENMRSKPIFSPSPASICDRLVPLNELCNCLTAAGSAWSCASPPKPEWVTYPPSTPPSTLRGRLDTAVGGLILELPTIVQVLGIMILVNAPTMTTATAMTNPDGTTTSIPATAAGQEQRHQQQQRLHLVLERRGSNPQPQSPSLVWLLTVLPFVRRLLADLDDILTLPGRDAQNKSLRVWAEGALTDCTVNGSAALWDEADRIVRTTVLEPLARLADCAPELLESLYGDGGDE